MTSTERRASGAPRDASAFEVRSALEQPGCPICRLALRAVGRFIWSLAYEQVNDPGVRAELRAAHGFCTVHAYRWLREAHSPLGTAIIYRDVLRAALTELEQAATADRTSSPSLALLRTLIAPDEGASASLCPACRAQQEAEDRYVGALLASLVDPAVAEAFAGSDGLCLTHTFTALRQGGGTTSVVLEQTRRSVERLIGHLDEVIRKEDYRFRTEPRSEDERAAPLRAVTWAAGAQGLVR